MVPLGSPCFFFYPEVNTEDNQVGTEVLLLGHEDDVGEEHHEVEESTHTAASFVFVKNTLTRKLGRRGRGRWGGGEDKNVRGEGEREVRGEGELNNTQIIAKCINIFNVCVSVCLCEMEVGESGAGLTIVTHDLGTTPLPHTGEPRTL